MLKKKSSTSEKKRKHFQSEERHDSGKRRSTGPGLEVRLSGLAPLLNSIEKKFRSITATNICE